jgi:hypothetical protein
VMHAHSTMYIVLCIDFHVSGNMCFVLFVFAHDCNFQRLRDSSFIRLSSFEFSPCCHSRLHALPVSLHAPRESLGTEGIFDAKPAIMRAFMASKDAVKTKHSLSQDYVERNEFRSAHCSRRLECMRARNSSASQAIASLRLGTQHVFHDGVAE